MIVVVDESGWETMPSGMLSSLNSILVISHDGDMVAVAKDREDRFRRKQFPLSEMGQEIIKALEMRRIRW